MAAVLNIFTNFLVIPHFRENGAAFTTSLTELFWLVSVVWLMPRDLLTSENARVATRTLLAAGATAILLLPIQGLDLVIGLPLALALFAVLAVLLRAVSTSDLLALRAPMPRFRAETAPLTETPLPPGAAK